MITFLRNMAFACFSLACVETTLAIDMSFFDGSVVVGEVEDEDLFKHFPFQNYSIVKVRSLGSFYIDPIDDCIKNVLRRSAPWEAEVASVLKQYSKKGSTVLDIGSHIGTHTVTLSRAVGSNGTVIAFEPQRKIFSELVQNMLLNDYANVVAYRAAVGEREDTVEMNTSYPNNEGATQIGSGGDQTPMTTIDSFHLTNVSLMKIDVENYEDMVLDGAYETIMANRPVLVIEIMGHKASAGPNRMDRIQKTKQKIKNLGYKIQHLVCDEYIAIPN